LEFLENIFDSLCSALLSPLVKAAFLEGEGVELCVLMMKERKVSWTRSVKVLDHAMSGRSGIELCEKFVEALGLKTLFKAFMGKVRSRQLSYDTKKLT
jgi:beta-catenin-like protein 1